MAADWSNTITINIFLAPLPPARAGFGTVLLLAPLATNSLNGERVASYASAAEAEAAETAGYISATTLAFLVAAFGQQPTPSKVKVAWVDLVGGDGYDDALAEVEAVDTDWYCVTIDSRADAGILEISGAIETRNKLCVVQSDDASWLTSGLPAGLSALAARERTAVVYHDEDTEPADIGWAASRLVFDPDFRSAGWEGQVRGVAALTTGLTSAQRDFVEGNNANVGLPFSSAPVYMSPGVNCNGRGLYEIVTADWFKARVSEDLALLKLQHTARGEKIVVDESGQAKVMAILLARLQQGEDAGHFARGETRATAEAITASDIANRRLRFKVEAQIAADARLFTVNVYLQPDPLQEA
jgi:hypothetical protein